MTYRILNINDKKYKYVIGKTHTKVVGVGSVLNSVIGYEVVSYSRKQILEYVVTPDVVRRYILGQPTKRTMSCRHGTTTDKYMINPFENEIYQKTCYMIACEECYNTQADEI